MNALNKTETVKEQYKNADNLNRRISIHDKYSVNKTGWGNWIISNYKIKNGSRILELGCGTGNMWKGHLDLIDGISELVLTDFSEEMVKTARENLGENRKISCRTADIQQIPFEDNSFDTVIANMMLYHVPDLKKGLAEVKRVLKNDGDFYCATFGENGIMKYVSECLKDYGVKDGTSRNFTLQNGGEILSEYFSRVQRLDYEDALEVTDIRDMIDYIYSLSGMTAVKDIPEKDIEQAFVSRMENGVLRVPKEYGMFICSI